MKRLIILAVLAALLVVGGSGGVQQAAAIPTLGLCLDGFDNDGDGLIDQPVGTAYPSIPDPGCADPFDNTEWRIEGASGQPACADMLDNDGDGGVDWDDDPSEQTNTVRDVHCDSPTDNDETTPPPPAPPSTNADALIVTEGMEGDPECPVTGGCLRDSRPGQCYVNAPAPNYGLVDFSDPSAGATVAGRAFVECTVFVRSIRICVSLFRSTFAGGLVFHQVNLVTGFPLDCSEGEFVHSWFPLPSVYRCNFWGAPIHSRSWYTAVQVRIIFNSGDIGNGGGTSKRAVNMCV